MFLYYIVTLFSLMLYLYGFFPLSKKTTGNTVTELPTKLYDVELHPESIFEPEFDRLILIIIDALRMDFVNNNAMPLLMKKSNKKGCFLTVNVESPTVTLPRIKALTSGAIPQFIDIILNLFDTELLPDSFLHRAIARNKHLIFYGDNTWLKLYPNLFKRYEGTTSFYVNDFYEVDNNVTRNLNVEFKKKDWDIMFLHYLGLDHIGHVYGPQSNLIPHKLLEMDHIIHNIYKATQQDERKTLIAVTSDHGMKDSGGHGGATFAETTVPLLLFDHVCNNSTIDQTDVAATLSILMGIEIPMNSIGQLATNVFTNFSYKKLLYVLRYNALILNSKSSLYADVFKNATETHYQYLKNNNHKTAINAVNFYKTHAQLVSTVLKRSSTKQNPYFLVVASCLLFLNFISELCYLLKCDIFDKKHKYISCIFTIAAIVLQIIVPENLLVTGILVLGTTYIILKNLFCLKIQFNFKSSCDNLKLLLIGMMLYTLSLFSSSFIEEEHQFWYFFAGSFILFNAFTNFYWLPLFIGLRFVRTINQTGDKWASLPDLKQWLLQSENYVILHLFVIISLIYLFFCCYNKNNKPISILNAWIIVLIYIFKNFDAQNVNLGKFLWFLIFLSVIFNITNKVSLTNSWILICTLLLRPHNVILIPACFFASSVLHQHVKNVNALILAHVYLGNVLFFCQGHSNSLASVDVASGYVGLQQYHPLLVIIQVLCHTYALPILSHFLLFQNNFMYNKNLWCILICFRTHVLTVTCILTLSFRHHLFVWSVFAPKLLIESTHFVITLLELCFYYLYQLSYNKLKIK